MAYDLHLVRTEDWTQAADAPITKQDVAALMAADPELAWSTTDYVDMSDEAGAVTRYWMMTWRGQPCFWWYQDQVLCSDPDEAQISKLVQMSRVLRARVFGDDGEEYPLEQQPAPPTSQPPSAAPGPTLWPLWKQFVAAFLLGCVLLALKLLIFGG
ncbi:MAG: hypothetical protein AAGN66_09560 [Acidobacteriota bacterium]